MATAPTGSRIPQAEHLFKKAVEGIASQLQSNEGEAASLPLLFDSVCNKSSAATQSFCRELVETIYASVATVSAYSRQRAREKALSRFHQLRINTLPGIWRRIEAKLSILPTKAAMAQSVNRFIFNEVMLRHFTPEHVQISSPKACTELSTDEEAAVRYAGGFVAMKLKKRFMKQNNTKARQFVECLSHMAIDGEETSFLDYTRMWTVIVNRGGLFDLNDATHLLFKFIEVQTQNVLPQHLRSPASETTKQQLVEGIMKDEDVQIVWNLLSLDIDNDDDCQALLKEVVGLWVTIRGYAMTSFWMEQYKVATREEVKKKKSLRKDLKKKSEE